MIREIELAWQARSRTVCLLAAADGACAPVNSELRCDATDDDELDSVTEEC
jgi:hypothetical protein